MSKLTPDESVKADLSETIRLIEKHTDRVIWRTSMRIHELIQLENPDWKRNYFLRERQGFLYVLFMECFAEDVTAIFATDLYTNGERYEESMYEPVCFADIQVGPTPKQTIPKNQRGRIYPYTSIDVRSILTERRMLYFMQQGLDFHQASAESRVITPEERELTVDTLKEKGMARGNVFYKRIIGTKKSSIDELPALPVTVD